MNRMKWNPNLINCFRFSRMSREWIRDHRLKRAIVLVDMGHNRKVDLHAEIHLVRLKVQITTNTTRATVNLLGVFHHQAAGWFKVK